MIERTGPASPLGPPRPETPAQEKLWQAAQGFEALLLNELMKGARQTDLGGDLLSSEAGDTAQSLLDTEVTRLSAQRSDLGIAAAVYRQFRGAVE